MGSHADKSIFSNSALRYCKLYVRMGLILLILFSKQPSDFLSIQIF